MTDDDRQRAAKTILEIPFFNDLMDGLEKTAVDGCVFAKYDDHQARQAYAAEARAIRNLRGELEAIANGQSKPRRQAPA